MSIKVCSYKVSKLILEVACIAYFCIGVNVLFLGLAGLLWSDTASSCLRAGSYIIASFIAIGSATMGFLGAYDDNFCMLIAYGIILTVSLTVRTVTTLIMLKLSKNIDEAIEIPSLISGLPGTSSLLVELFYALLETILSLSAFTLSSIITEKESLEHLNPKLYHTAPEKNLLYGSSNVI